MATLPSRTIERNALRTPRELEVPAPTAWPFVLAFGSTLLFAGLVTSSRSAFSALYLRWRAASGGSAKFSRANMKKLCRWFQKIFARQPSAESSNGFRSRPISCVSGFPSKPIRYRQA